MHREVQQYIESIPGVTYLSTASATPTTKELQVDDWMIKDVAGRGGSSIMVAAFHRHTAELAVARSMKRNESGFKRFQKRAYAPQSRMPCCVQHSESNSPS
ncbi:hypothetical protein Slin15195_G130280 [Septoria linicola]|uniref:Uncharacterized protein n=1 Tax=Septoria linicola TaxID=215465 RepID=A0A9Q9B2B5_9PEZI|nr:hypothetical protein Slin15195_G130280 [Septoria linicola]